MKFENAYLNIDGGDDGDAFGAEKINQNTLTH